MFADILHPLCQANDTILDTLLSRGYIFSCTCSFNASSCPAGRRGIIGAWQDSSLYPQLVRLPAFCDTVQELFQLRPRNAVAGEEECLTQLPMGDTESLRVYPRNFVPDAANESQMLCKGKRKYALNVSNQQAQPIVLIASREYFAQSQRPPLMGYDLLLGGNQMTLRAVIASKAEQPSLNRYTTWFRQSAETK